MDVSRELFDKWDCEVYEAVVAASTEGPIASEDDFVKAICQHLHPTDCEPARSTGSKNQLIEFGWAQPAPNSRKGIPKQQDVTCDCSAGGPPGPVIEVKNVIARENKIYEAIWDLFKLINIVEGGQAQRGYLCVRASADYWKEESPGSELFQPRGASIDRSTARLLGVDPEDTGRRRLWDWLRSTSAGEPVEVPEFWDCSLIGNPIPVRPSVEIRVAAIERPGCSWTTSY